MRLLCFAFLLLLLTQASGQRITPPPAAELEAITQRGKALAEYDAAAWQATDNVQALRPDKKDVGRYIAKKIDGHWHVVFGHLTDKQDAFAIGYEWLQVADGAKVSAKLFEAANAAEDRGFYLFAARAIDTALKHFEPAQNRPHNVAVLPADDGKLFVYVYPASTVVDVYPIGGDVRFLIAPDGMSVIETHRMHYSIIEPDPKASKEIEKVTMGFHTHVIDDIPEDTDVFHVLQTHAPEYVASKKYFYKVVENGTILYIGETKKVLESK